MVTSLLLRRGWRDVRSGGRVPPSSCGQPVGLLWTVRGGVLDLARLDRATLVNHFETASPLTTKCGLARCLAGMRKAKARGKKGGGGTCVSAAMRAPEIRSVCSSLTPADAGKFLNWRREEMKW